MPTIFSKIIAGKIPCHKIAETQDCFAFLDIQPLAKGHVLVIPKQETDYIFNLPDGLLGKLHVFAKEVALAIEEVIDCERIGVAVLGLEVPHAHIHLVPVNSIGDINFERKRLNFSEQEFAQTAADISAAYNAKQG